MSDLIVKGNHLVGTTNQIDYLLLDSSSSMTSRWWDCLDAIDAYIKECRAKHVTSRLMMQAFSSADLDYEWRNGPLESIALMSDDPPGMHGGGTPLFDAIQLMARRLKELNPAQCSVVIITDGDENGSTRTTEAQARMLLDWMRLRGWQVTFIGCDFDNNSIARRLGANAGSALGTSAKRLGEATRLLATKRANYGRSGEDIEYTEGERQRFGGYLGSSQ